MTRSLLERFPKLPTTDLTKLQDGNALLHCAPRSGMARL